MLRHEIFSKLLEHLRFFLLDCKLSLNCAKEDVQLISVKDNLSMISVTVIVGLLIDKHEEVVYILETSNRYKYPTNCTIGLWCN